MALLPLAGMGGDPALGQPGGIGMGDKYAAARHRRITGQQADLASITVSKGA